MANKGLFRSLMGRLIPATNTVNEEWAPAYSFTPKHALAQYAATGCMNTTFYASAETQLQQILDLCAQVEPEFIARTALHCRQAGAMKDTPALLCAVLSVRSPELLEKVFDRVIDNGKMLRNFVQIMRSGVVGRKSLGSLPKRLVRRWLESRSDDALFRASVGQDPSMADVLKMVHPKPRNASREALYGYLIGRDCNAEVLPELVKQYEAYKAGRSAETPDVPFEMLTSLELGTEAWTAIARKAPWQMTRMNLNTFVRHGVFEQPGIADLVAARLRDPAAIARSRALPYQLMVAYTMADESVPGVVREALQDAMETAIANVPQIDGRAFIFPDVSGSMSSAVTGCRKGSTTAVRCIDVAALVAAAMLRKNPRAEVIPFEQGVVKLALNPRDSVMTNAGKLSKIGGGGTNCSAPLALLNSRKATGDLVVYVSDNESWVDAGAGRGTATMQEWSQFKARNPNARMVCIDLQPYGSTQAAERPDILNVGGFSDRVFEIVTEFAAGRLTEGHWVDVIEKTEL